MIKVIKFIFYMALLCLSFFLGVNYSEQTKKIGNWLFETKEQEIDYKDIEKDLRNNKQTIEVESIKDNSETNPEITDEDDILGEGEMPLDVINDSSDQNEQ